MLPVDKAIAVDSVYFIMKIACDYLRINFPLDAQRALTWINKSDPVKSYLTSIDLVKYYSNFIKSGFKTMVKIVIFISIIHNIPPMDLSR